MKDAKGHGSDPRGATSAPKVPMAAHQSGIMSRLPSKDQFAKYAAAAYIAQAAGGAAVGFTIPILKALGVF